ncbi:hypothetical protein AUR64_01235 [Haloprofundus marisrubri]|uniref:Peptidase M48 domain-containing protein n=1 Tax=Haloprofundus marisrubri TaxID=1514971 RepID=A0A0W1R465_9EURY|nr:M48 family metalloprotease [Haloprofundus marisrubri]KTG07887.1 hypothetical protein AUR64_01235 [Haloprofundus marisrubri]
MARNWSLGGRLLVALALVAAGYLLLVAPLFVIFREWFAVVATVTLTAVPLFLILFGHRLALSAAGAAYVDPDDYPELFSSLHRLSQQAGVSTPRLAVVANDDPNAFTAGSGDRAVVCATTGLLRKIDADEREAVFAHELAHLKNHDAVVMTLAAFPLTVSGLFLTLSEATMHESQYSGLLPVGIGLVLLFPPLVLLPISYPAVLVIANAREYAADSGAIALTGKPAALASALRTLGDIDEKPERDMRSLGPVSAFCIVAPSWSSLQFPGLHPPTEKRIERLHEMERTAEATTGQ